MTVVKHQIVDPRHAGGTLCVSPTSANCYYSASPALAFDFSGQAFTDTFTCGPAVGPASPAPPPYGANERDTSVTDLSGGTANATIAGLVPGCYDVTATVTNESEGGAVPITNATCGYVAAGPQTSNVNCAGYQSPLCPYGSVSSTAGGTCNGGGTGITPDTAPYSGSKMSVTINPGKPDSYSFSYTGYTPLLNYCTNPPDFGLTEASGSGNPGDRGLCYADSEPGRHQHLLDRAGSSR